MAARHPQLLGWWESVHDTDRRFWLSCDWVIDHWWLDLDCSGWRASVTVSIFLGRFGQHHAQLSSPVLSISLHRTSWWNLSRRGLAGCKLRDYPVDGRWTLTTPADFRCHGRTWQVGPKVESRFGLLRFFEILCKNKSDSFFFSFKGLFWNIFFVIPPQSVNISKPLFSYWWFLMTFCVSRVSQVLGSAHRNWWENA